MISPIYLGKYTIFYTIFPVSADVYPRDEYSHSEARKYTTCGPLASAFFERFVAHFLGQKNCEFRNSFTDPIQKRDFRFSRIAEKNREFLFFAKNQAIRIFILDSDNEIKNCFCFLYL